MGFVTTTSLLTWYRTRARDLPWRRVPRDPYPVLVSEFMLQQTQVDRVVPRFVEFMKRFPNLDRLAAASEEEVLTAWSGLGYYRRARLLHRLAGEVVSRCGGFPKSAVELETLPGVGPYTAAAVASMAFGEAVPVLDGNVMRVGARVLAMEENPRSAVGRRRLQAWIRGLMEGNPPGQVNEALMELGAVICAPSDPDCGSCPFVRVCGARAEGRPEAYPQPRRRRGTVSLRWVAACAVDPERSWLLRRVDDGPILRGLWLPPLAEISHAVDPVATAKSLLPGCATSPPETTCPVRHNITHRKIDVVPVRVEIGHVEPPSDDWRWVDPENPGVPTSSLLAKLAAALDR
jgi:A/G-specific adenine glycosylase